MLTQTSHLATATATSRVEMVEVSRDSFTHLLSTRPLLRERVMRRSRLRYTASWRAIGANSVFATFSMAQARHARCPQPPTAPPIQFRCRSSDARRKSMKRTMGSQGAGGVSTRTARVY